jgi:short-subunit dehydrogenase
MKGTALITGSTSGIGLHLAHQFAKNGHPLVLVAPDAGELATLGEELISAYGITVYSIPADLEAFGAEDEIFRRVSSDGVVVEILVNNGGHGFRGKSWELSIDRDLSMVRLNIEAVLRLTKWFLPPMVANGRGKILNTASVAGFEPGPMLNVYHATKAFLLSYSEGLCVELEGSGVTVTALCPGPTDTDFFIKADMINVMGFQKGNLMAPQSVAEEGYRGLMDEEMIVIPGAANKALVAGRRILTEHAQAKLNEKFYEEVPPEDRTRSRGDVENAAAV